MKAKTPKDSQVETRHLVMPSNSNPHGTVFGGTIMSWMDMAAAMVASRHCNNPTVTVHISDIDFINPIKVGQHVVIKSSINYVGNSSMVIGCRVESEDPYLGVTLITTKAYLTFVAVDKFNRPIAVPELIPESEDEKRRFDNARKRVEARKALRKTLKNS